MCDSSQYEICACAESRALLDALERAWAEIPLGAKRADAILKDALDAHHASTIASIETILRGV